MPSPRPGDPSGLTNQPPYARVRRGLARTYQRPVVPFDEGLARTVEWYRVHPDWVREMRAGAGA